MAAEVLKIARLSAHVSYSVVPLFSEINITILKGGENTSHEGNHGLNSIKPIKDHMPKETQKTQISLDWSLAL